MMDTKKMLNLASCTLHTNANYKNGANFVAFKLENKSNALVSKLNLLNLSGDNL